MAYTCQYCATLSIHRLVELAREDFSSCEFSPKKFFAHHESIDDLDASAQKGCGLCQLIIDCFKGTPTDGTQWDSWPSGWPNTWQGPDCPQNSSVYSYIKQSQEETDIKLCINTRNLYVSDSFEIAAVLDNVLVQVGVARVEDGDTIRDSHFAFLALGLSTAADQPKLLDGVRIGKFRVEEDLGSTTNFSIAKAWLHDCQTSHSTCHSKGLPQLPSRVIDVGSDELDIPRIIPSQGAAAHYVALSHCWGGNIPVLLTTETITDFQKALPLPELSQNFRDAIQITQRLGVRFLWIDSLCILQNSKSDWQFESRQMGRIYRDSTLTIYAAASDRSTAGILCQKAKHYSRLPEPAYIALRPRTHDPDQQQQLVRVSWLPPEEEYLKSLYSDSPLYSRGWCLQESVLAPRQLIYGASQLYWRCQARYQSADGTPEGFRYPEDNYKNFTSLILSDTLAASSPFRGPQPPATEIIEAAMKDYYGLVQDYSNRTLTYGSDKLPGFSGLARLLQPILPAGASYFAGLWSTDIHRGLLWSFDVRGCKHVNRSPFRAPSWSWAVTDSGVLILPSEPVDQPNPLDMTMLESHIVLQDPEDSFGEIMSAALCVRARVFRLVRSTQVVRMSFGAGIGQCHFDEEDHRADYGIQSWLGSLFVAYEGDEEEQFILSVILEYGKATDFVVDTTLLPSKEQDDMILMLVRITCDEDDPNSVRVAECLVLQRTKDDAGCDAYERFGVARLIDLEVEWLMGWESAVLNLI